MDLIRPIAVSAGMVTTNAVDADPQWVAGTTYAAGAKVTRERRIWISLQAGNVGHTPGAAGAEAWWSDAGSANSWAMFDDKVQTVTQRDASLSVTVQPIGAQVVALLNVRGMRARVQSSFNGAAVFDKTISLWDTSVIANWGDFYFNEPEFRSEAVFVDLPPVIGQVVTITVEAPGGTAQLGMVVMGKPLNVGLEKVGLQRSGIDYSQATFDQFGEASITKRAYARKVSTQTLIENKDLDRITRRLDQLASVPVLVLSGSGRFGSTVVFGLVSYTVDVAMYAYSYVSIDVKGLI
ncbi:hypothetical protein [Delftia sp. PS-11]|uniref:hypothetical protein n=1 Tax=Delftia sp. PS-11 TaxID=2767222 RepID=UPI0024579070|nr:hypothetical protein [Delftia sp. PS-11]KAJ8743693.1 hypothetical protein H9T68_15975 [Delftia sp. PS-11]